MDRTYSLGLYEKAMPGGMTFESMLESTQKSGFDFLEISIDETDERLSRLDWDQNKRLHLLAASRRINIPIKSICLSGHRRFPFGSHDAAKRQRSLEIIKKAVELAADIGNLKNASLQYQINLVEDLRCGAGHIFAAHLKETLPGIYRNRNFGDGHTDYVPCIKELYAQGVRIFTGEFWYNDEENYLNTLCMSSKFLRDKIEQAY